MKTSTLLALATPAIAASIPPQADAADKPFVWGGDDTAITEVPWQIEFDVNGRFGCGGSIISNRHILTAGHCVQGQTASRISIRVGSNQVGQGRSYKASKVQAHPKFRADNSGIDYDMAIVTLAQPLTFSDSVQAISIVDAAPQAGADALLSGWGETGPDHNYPQTLQSVHYPIISKADCKRLNGNNWPTSDRFICALQPGGGKGSCYGDSGGPLVVGGKLAGSVSGGYECAGARAPSTYADLAHPEIRSFIKQAAGV
ncbi:hypothetical protein V2A60_009506 [Cordyceps javanica]|uniref:Trypsin-like serine protease n=1 Tax=Cordyceps javanica TaxID=43265 RepID=A0A545VMF5_9HYPO|nr:trypsin-like serine protease [Cordyceps javanica]TQW02890.1 trypsin-like serine protease [Cordyceps javanica]